MAYKCKIVVGFTYTSWALVFCIDADVCAVSKVISINEEKEMCLPTREYICGHR